MRSLAVFTGMLAMLLSLSCKDVSTNCETLVKAACDHVSDRQNGQERCERIRKEAESVSDDSCKETLRLLKESGKLQKTSR